MSDPLISVLIATYNQSQFLAECIDSLVSQTIPISEVEVIVVNDGSTDNTISVLESYSGKLDRIISHQKRQGLASACNTGLKHTQGQYIVRVDSDDYLESNALEMLKTAARKTPDADIITPAYWVLDGKKTTLLQTDPKNGFTWLAGGVLLNRESVVTAGGYRDYYWEEYDLYLRMMEQGSEVSSISEPILYYRKHGGNMTYRKRARMEGWRELIEEWPSASLRRFGSHEELDEIFRV